MPIAQPRLSAFAENPIWTLLTLSSVVLLISSVRHWVAISPTEVLGFITGAVCVLLVVKQNIWNFPVGIANNVFFIALFLSSRLYGDMALQGFYVVLGVLGWWQWLHGGTNQTQLRVSRTSGREVIILFLIGIAATIGMRHYFVKMNDSAPFLDALTTSLSLIAQYLLNCKRLENWFVWIAADLLYVSLYIQKGLYLTAALYAIFIGMCVAGFLSWRDAETELENETVSYEAVS